MLSSLKVYAGEELNVNFVLNESEEIQEAMK